MHARVPALFILATLALAAFAAPAGAVPNFTVDYSDPASDVEQLWTSNRSAVLDANGDPISSPFPDAINILWVRSRNATDPANVTISVETQGSIANRDDTSYEFQLYTQPTDASYFRVTYVNGTTILDSTDSSFPSVDISGNSTITSTGPNPTLRNLLRINVEKSHLDPIDSWNVRLLALQVGPTYTYRDWGWELPGNPGSSPTILEGIVTEAGTGAPLAGVNVSTDIGGYWTLTNTTGGYSLPLTSGTYNVTFARDGYASQVFQVTIATGETEQVNVQLTRLGFGLGGDSILWIALAIVSLVALLAIVAIVLLRKKRSPPPAP